MGRLFQYNRFGAHNGNSQNNNGNKVQLKKQQQLAASRQCGEYKEHQQHQHQRQQSQPLTPLTPPPPPQHHAYASSHHHATYCQQLCYPQQQSSSSLPPSYAEVYPVRCRDDGGINASTTGTVTSTGSRVVCPSPARPPTGMAVISKARKITKPTTTIAMALAAERKSAKAAEATEAASAPTTVATKNVELAIKKYQQWSSKFLLAATAATITQPPTPTTTSMTSTSTSTTTTTTSSKATAAKRTIVANTFVSQTTSSAATTSPRTRCSASTAKATETSTSPTSSAASSCHNKSKRRTTNRQSHWGSDREMLLSGGGGGGGGLRCGTDGCGAAVRATTKPKVYDCMKEFLRRKLFLPQHQHTSVDANANALKSAAAGGGRLIYACVDDEDEDDEDVTSDYDEVDVLDTSYNADEEEDEGELDDDDEVGDVDSDCNSDCTYPLTSGGDSSSDEDLLIDIDTVAMLPPSHSATATTAAQKVSTPRKSLLSLNCWQTATNTDTASSEEEDVLGKRSGVPTESDDDSDAGISDCCQLIGGGGGCSSERSPRRRVMKSNAQTQIATTATTPAAGDNELLESAWYQPHLSMKAALERLHYAEPGCFLVRRKSNTFELLLRVATKVKQFTIITASSHSFKLKGARKEFSTLKALVTHHSVMAEQLPLTLTLPREQHLYTTTTSSSTLASTLTYGSKRPADDFDTFESLQILGILKSLQAKNLEFC